MAHEMGSKLARTVLLRVCFIQGNVWAQDTVICSDSTTTTTIEKAPATRVSFSVLIFLMCTWPRLSAIHSPPPGTAAGPLRWRETVHTLYSRHPHMFSFFPFHFSPHNPGKMWMIRTNSGYLIFKDSMRGKSRFALNTCVSATVPGSLYNILHLIWSPQQLDEVVIHTTMFLIRKQTWRGWVTCSRSHS